MVTRQGKYLRKQKNAQDTRKINSKIQNFQFFFGFSKKNARTSKYFCENAEFLNIFSFFSLELDQVSCCSVVGKKRGVLSDLECLLY